MAREQLAGIGAFAIAVIHFIFNQGVRGGDQPSDALFLVNDPALDAELAELRSAGEDGIFEGAKKRRIGQGIERYNGGFDRQFSGERLKVRGGISASGL